MKSILMFLFFLMSLPLCAQSDSETINKEIAFEKATDKNALMVANINGTVKVTGYDGDKIIMQAVKTITAKTNERLQMGKQELQLGILNRVDTIIFYIKDGCHQFGKKKNSHKNGWTQNGWGYNWDVADHSCETLYDYVIDITLKVPKDIHLVLSTINEGNIDVENVRGQVKANNVNGSVRLANLEKEAMASTINGDVDIDYNKFPLKECRFYSLNGDINAFFPKGLAANLSFESFNGEFYTNLENIQQLPAKVEKTKRGESMRYKVNGNTYQVGNGGVFLEFETFNGNVYLKEK